MLINLVIVVPCISHDLFELKIFLNHKTVIYRLKHIDNNIQSLGIHTQIDNKSTNENPIFVHPPLNGLKKVRHIYKQPLTKIHTINTGTWTDIG